ncbi:MAG: LamG-like jellyroll fold domain-containing protein [Candidatus Jorgensenbacteria bacterium]
MTTNNAVRKNKKVISHQSLVISRDGQSLIEVLIGLSIGAILIGAASLGIVFILRSSTTTQYLQSGTQFNQDLVDRARSVAAADWADLYGLTKGTGTSYFVSASGTELIAVEGREGVLSNEIFDGLVGHWNFDEATSTATTTTFDTSGKANHGTVASGAATRATSTCKVSYCLNFNGLDDGVNIGNSSDYNSSAFSLSMWIKPVTIKSGDQFNNIVMGRESYLSSGFRFGIRDSGKMLFWTNQSGGTLSLQSNNSITTSNFYHIVVTYSGTTGIMYFNGVADASTTGSYVVPTGVTMWINGGIGGTQESNSYIDDIRWYNRALSADDVQRLWNSTVFTRYFTIENVMRDSNGDIAASGNDDPSTQKITSYVKWPGAGTAVGQVAIVDYVTRWANRVFNQSDWSGGEGDSGVLTDPSNRYYDATSVSNPAGSIRIEGL